MLSGIFFFEMKFSDSKQQSKNSNYLFFFKITTSPLIFISLTHNLSEILGKKYDFKILTNGL
jgi:hypothetical protein